ncbi:MAG: translocation/assembly module TamB domain-containing protein, partial [Verrucomicrobiota bacterium]
RRRWRVWRWLGFMVAAGAAVLIFVLAGPGGRWLLDPLLERQLDAVGFEGEWRLQGSLWNGLVWRNVKVSSRTNAESLLEAGELSLEADFSSLARGRWANGLKRVRARDVELVLSEALLKTRSSPSGEEDGEPVSWSLLPRVELDLEGVGFRFMEGASTLWALEDLNVSLPRQGEGSIGLGRLMKEDEVLARDLAAGLSATSMGLRLDHLAWRDFLEIRRLEAKVGDDETLLLESELDVGGGRIDLFVDPEAESGRAELADGSIDLAFLNGMFPQLKLEHGSLSSLKIEGKGWSDWKKGEARLEVAGVGFQWSGYTLDQLSGRLQFHGGQLVGEDLLLVRGEERMTVQMETTWLPGEDWEKHRFDLETSIDGEAFDGLGLEDAISGWKGIRDLKGDLSATVEGGRVEDLSIDLSAAEVGIGPATLPELRLQAKSDPEDSNLLSGKLTSGLSEQNGLTVAFTFDQENRAYEGTAVLGFEDVGFLKSIVSPLADLPVESGGGSVRWKGSGDLFDRLSHQGDFHWELSKVQSAWTSLAEGRGSGVYGDGRWALEKSEFVNGRQRLELGETYYDSQKILHCRSLAFRFDGESIVEGGGDLSFGEETPEKAFEVQIARTPLGRIGEWSGKEWEALSGDLGGRLRWAGPWSRPDAVIELGIDGLTRDGEEGPTPQPARIALAGRLQNQILSVTGGVDQADLNGLNLQATMPLKTFDWGDIQQQPVQGRATLGSTSLKPLSAYVEGLAEMEGQLAGDFEVAGTPAALQWRGRLKGQIATLRWDHATSPELKNGVIDIGMVDRSLEFDELRGELAGGNVAISGSVGLEDLRKPVFDLEIEGNKALLARDENLIVRCDGRVGLSGGWESASITGRVALVESRYFREIEIIPSDLPQQSVPVSGNELKRQLGIATVPFKDWKVDVRVETEEPFRIRSNLATVDLGGKLRVSGRGEQLSPRGCLAVEEGFVSLPFCRLNLGNSALKFDEDTGWLGDLDVRGVGNLRDVEVKLFGKGHLSEMKTYVTSNPPKSREDILSLVATGSTREELLSGANVAASKAAVLLFDRLWRKISGKDWEDPEVMRRRRLTWEANRVNTRTGKNMTSARLELRPGLYLLGDADIEGGYRGLLKVLWRY